LIPELAAKKLAGLAIKPGRYIEKMVNRLAVTAVEMRYYNEFINEMLLADLAEEKNLRQRGKNLGLDLGRTHIAAMVCRVGKLVIGKR
jgi:hypothetical protein